MAITVVSFYILLFYFREQVEEKLKLGISKLFRVENTELWRVRFTADGIFDIAAIALLQLLIYFIFSNKAYSTFCLLFFICIQVVGIFLTLLNIFFTNRTFSVATEFLLDLSTEPFLTLVLIAAYPLFKLDNTLK